MQAYLDLLTDILESGTDRGDRTGTGTRSVFGRQLRFNLNKGFPILTTKRVHFKSVVNELIWFLSGDTNTRWLRENGVSIWDEWATDEGELGPLYGAQWHSWPTKEGASINQIDYVVDCLKHRPESRRILFHAWNVEYLPDEAASPQDNVRAGKMALPPCHLLYQFYVAGANCLLSSTSAPVMSFLVCPSILLRLRYWFTCWRSNAALVLGTLLLLWETRIFTAITTIKWRLSLSGLHSRFLSCKYWVTLSRFMDTAMRTLHCRVTTRHRTLPRR